MAVFFYVVLGAAVAAAFILAFKWAWMTDHQASLTERFKQIVSGWGKEE